MRQVVLSDVVGGRLPYLVVGHDVAQDVVQIFDAMRPAYGVGMKGDSHEPAVFLTLLVQLVKLCLADLSVVVCLVVVSEQGRIV